MKEVMSSKTRNAAKENPGDLKWTRIPESLKEEAGMYEATAIMEIYKDPNTSDERKKWCRNIMVAKYERYIYQLIHTSFHSFCPNHTCEFFQNGVIGLLKAMNANFDGKHSFTTYCKGYINHELSSLAGHLLHGQTSHYAMLYKKVLRAQSDLKARGVEPTAAMISILTEIPESSVKKCLDVQQRTDFVYMDGMEDPSYISESYETPDKIVEQQEEMESIHKAVDSLDPDRAKIVKMYFGICTCEHDMEFVPDKGMKFKEISQVLGIPVPRVKSELNAALCQFRTSDAFSDSYQKVCSRSRLDLDRIDIQQPTREAVISEMEATAAAILEFEDSDSFDLESAFCG